MQVKLIWEKNIYIYIKIRSLSTILLQGNIWNNNFLHTMISKYVFFYIKTLIMYVIKT